MKDPSELNDWVASLLRDRYTIVKEERDAYRQLQDQFTGEMEVSQIQMKSSSQDLERLLNDVMMAKKETEEATRYIATALSIIGVRLLYLIFIIQLSLYLLFYICILIFF